MVNIIIFLLICFIICIITYYGVIFVIRKWTGCGEVDAQKKLRSYINGTPIYKFEEDVGLQNEIWDKVKKIIGEERYLRLVDWSYLCFEMPMYCYGMDGKLPYIAVTVDYNSIEEKRIIKNNLVKIMQSYLQAYGYNTIVLAVWKKRADINKRYLKMYFSRTGEEMQLLAKRIKEHQHS